MPIDFPIRTLWCTGTTVPSITELEKIKVWAQQNPPGWFHAGGGHQIGTLPNTLSWARWAELGRAAFIRSYLQRQGVECRSLIGFRFDVIQGERTQFVSPDPELGAQFVAQSTQEWKAVISAWAAKGYVLDRSDYIDPAFEAALSPNATLYTLPNAMTGKILPVSGFCVDMLAPNYREIMVRRAQEALTVWQADGLLVGCKPWLRFGQPYMLPGEPHPTGGLVQPSPYKKGHWGGGVALGLMALADAGISVLTSTRPPSPKLSTYTGPAPNILGEAQLTMLGDL